MPEFSCNAAISLSAEHLAMGYLRWRNILTYKAPSNNEGCDLVCIHTDPRKPASHIRVQVKSRRATDSDKSIIIKPGTLDGFDYLMVVYLNPGYFLRMAERHPLRGGLRDPVFLTLPNDVVRRHIVPSNKWGKVRFRWFDRARFLGTRGFDPIADELGIPSPGRGKAGAEPLPRLCGESVEPLVDSILAPFGERAIAC
jgi:hypothetical protein